MVLQRQHRVAVMRAGQNALVVFQAMGVCLVIAAFACKSREVPREPGTECDVGLLDLLCDGKHLCGSADDRRPEPVFGALVGIRDCRPGGRAILYGSWQLESAGSRPFEWEATVPRGGVFPSLGHTMVMGGCLHVPHHTDTSGFEYALDPDEHASESLQEADVFIPFGGGATLDHVSRATAFLHTRDGGTEPRVTVYVDESRWPTKPYAELGPGDSFAWDGLVATVVRIVSPQERWFEAKRPSDLGAIGWVEVKLSETSPPGATAMHRDK